MKKYLVEILYCGNDVPSHNFVEAKNEDDLYKKIDVLYYMGYEDVEEYEEEEEESYTKLNAQDCLDDIMSSEDVLLYILDLDSQREVFDHEDY